MALVGLKFIEQVEGTKISIFVLISFCPILINRGYMDFKIFNPNTIYNRLRHSLDK
jgi:hypothetical protein